MMESSVYCHFSWIIRQF